MAAGSPDDIVTTAMHAAAKSGLTGCLSLIERLAVCEGMGFPQPDVRQIVDEWQPKFNAVIEYYGQQRALRRGD